MIGILLITHEGIGEALLSTLNGILGQQPEQLVVYSLINDCDKQISINKIQMLAASLDDGDGLLVLTDLCGATPHNRAVAASLPSKTELVSGINLPMLIKAISYRHLELADLALKVANGAKDCIVVGECNETERT